MSNQGNLDILKFFTRTWMTFKGQIKVNLDIFQAFLPFSQKLCRNLFSILAWNFPMRILINCERIDVIEIAIKVIFQGRNSQIWPLFIYLSMLE